MVAEKIPILNLLGKWFFSVNNYCSTVFPLQHAALWIQSIFLVYTKQEGHVGEGPEEGQGDDQRARAAPLQGQAERGWGDLIAALHYLKGA